jgi:hypothetical protein
MLNILSIRCGLSFAPYLTDAMTGYLNDGAFNSRVVKQGGNGLILRSDTEMALRFEARVAALGHREARHYSATIAFRRDFYDITRMADEIIIANVGESLLLSYPQSELWLEADVIAALLRAYDNGADANAADEALPDWLKVSSGAGRLLLSDQRTGRWVLLGADHVAELERRAGLLAQAAEAIRRAKPPTLIIKGVTVHLQSAFKLADSLESFAESGNVMAFTEQAPGYELTVEKATEGIALRDFDQRAGLTVREARKYVAILRDELEQRHAVQFERGSLRTVIADGADGRWVLQWGDEILLTGEALASLREATSGVIAGNQVMRRDGEFLLLLEPTSGACVALTETEAVRISAGC